MDDLEHGIEAAYYANGPEYKFKPVVDCLCGWSSGRQSNLEDAGRLYDEHIAEVTK